MFLRPPLKALWGFGKIFARGPNILSRGREINPSTIKFPISHENKGGIIDTRYFPPLGRYLPLAIVFLSFLMVLSMNGQREGRQLRFPCPPPVSYMALRRSGRNARREEGLSGTLNRGGYGLSQEGGPRFRGGMAGSWG